MHLIAYISDSLIPESEVSEEIADIVLTARERNLSEHITGAFFFKNGRFLQILEGPEDNLRMLMSDIEKDARHENIEILVDRYINQKGFGSWDMNFFNLENDAKFSLKDLQRIRDGFHRNELQNSSLIMQYYKGILK